MNNDVLKECQAIGLDPKLAQRIQRSFDADRDAQLGMFEFSLLIVKHFCLDKRDRILDVITDTGLQVLASRKTLLGRMDAVRFAVVRAHGKGTALDVPEHSATLESLLKGPIEALIVGGADAVSRLSVVLGPDNPSDARRLQPQSARAVFGGSVLAENGLHCSATRREAHEELSLLFPNYIDLLKSKGYHSQVDQWLFSLWRSEPHSTLVKNRYLEVLRYSGNGQPVNQNSEFLGTVRNASTCVRDKFLHCISAIGSLLPSVSRTRQLPSVPTTAPPILDTSLLPLESAHSLTLEEEEEIACAALADELGVSDLSQYLPSRFGFPFQANQRSPAINEFSRQGQINAVNSDDEEFVDAPDHREWIRPHDFSHVIAHFEMSQPENRNTNSDLLTSSESIKAHSDTYLTRPGSVNPNATSHVASALEMYCPPAESRSRLSPSSVSRRAKPAVDSLAESSLI